MMCDTDQCDTCLNSLRRVYVCVCVRACVRACVRECVMAGWWREGGGSCFPYNTLWNLFWWDCSTCHCTEYCI